MSINNRVKELRKALKMSGEAFGIKIGLTKVGISNIETMRYAPTEQTIKSICREYNVNEEWLRYGTGEMFEPKPVLLEDLLQNTNDLEKNIIKTYLSIEPELRQQVLEQIVQLFNKPKQLE